MLKVDFGLGAYQPDQCEVDDYIIVISRIQYHHDGDDGQEEDNPLSYLSHFLVASLEKQYDKCAKRQQSN
jgi:hypothetical protein